MATSSWCLRERTKLGGDGGAWYLFTDLKLRVGRSSNCNIKFHSQSVENQHAVIKWDPKNVCYTLQDLGTVNGTYVNNCPLRGTSILLKHNDKVRFGYDKDRVFHVEESFSSPKSPPTQHSTSPRPRATSASSPATLQPPPAPVPVRVLGSGHAPTPSVQYVEVPTSAGPPTLPITTQPPPVSLVSQASSTSPRHHYHQQESPHPATTHTSSSSQSHDRGGGMHPFISHALPISTGGVDDLTSSLPSPHRSDGRRSVDLENSPALNRASKLYGQPNWWGEVGQEGVAEARDREFEFTKPGSQILRQLDPEVRRDYLTPKLSTKDELRLQAISNSQPQDFSAAWVVDLGGGVGGTLPKKRRTRNRDSRPRSADPSPNRLSSRQDTALVPKRAITPTAKRHSSVSSPRTTPMSTGARKQRAATPPVTQSTGTPVSRKPPCGEKHGSPTRKPLGKPDFHTTTPQIRAPTSSKKTHTGTSLPRTSRSKNPPSHCDPTSTLSAQTPHSPNSTTTKTTTPVQASVALVAEGQEKEDLSETTGIGLEHLKEGGLMSHLVKEDETYTAQLASSDESFSSLSDHTLSTPTHKPAVVVVKANARSERNSLGGSFLGSEVPGGEGEGQVKASVARKQWTGEETQSLDSLMIANIEARMRRLSRMAHQTARQVTALKRRVQEGYQMEVKVVNYLSLRGTSPVVSREEQKLPEWKSFNKEANSIFRNMRVVEKWLQDIEGTLSSIKPANESSEECIDFASDGELYLDSIDVASD